MADGKIELGGLPVATPGPFDTIAGVDKATGEGRQFPMPSPEGARGYATLANLQADLAPTPGTLAYVVHDPVVANNGLYRKTGASGSGSWVQSADRVTGLEGRVGAVESVTDRVNANDAEVSYDSSAFSRAFTYDNTGAEFSSTTGRTTDLIPVKAGDRVEVTSYSNLGTRGFILVYNAAQQFVRVVAAPVLNTVATAATDIEADGFVRAQWASNLAALPANGRVSVNQGRPLFLSPSNVAADPTIAAKASKILTEAWAPLFVQGGVGGQGGETESANEIRTAPLKLRPGTVVRMVTTGGFQFAWNTSATEVVPLGSARWMLSLDYTFTVPEGQPYVRFMFRRMPSPTATVPADAVNLSITTSSPVVYQKDLPDLTNFATKEEVVDLRSSAETRFIPTYRTPTLASGGVVSFIDDDGAAALYSALYPFLKARGVPFGAAVNPVTVGTSGYVTLAHLKEMAADTRAVEIMSHGFQHLNMTGLTPEQQHEVLLNARRWFTANGFEVEGFVYPNGGDSLQVHQVVSQYHTSAYDYGVSQNGGLQSFATIRNMSIKRFAFDTDLAALLANVTTAAATGQWLVICTHVENYDWTGSSWANLQTLLDHIDSAGCKIMLPSEAFHTFGNLLESDNGFRITAQGAMIPGL